MKRTFYLLLPLSLLLLAARPAWAAWPHGVYVWQRVQSDELFDTLIAQQSLFNEVRVLAAQSEEGRWAPMKPRWGSWRENHARLIPVFRLQGSEPPVDNEILLQRILAIREEWQRHGLAFSRIEIDFDCAERQLAAYRRLLKMLKPQLDARDIALDITALPAWLDHAEFHALANNVDRVTLQVHAVASPRAGLFDAKQAERWIRRLDAIINKPYSVALPAYGAGLLVSEDDTLLGVEHEADLAVRSDRRIEITADPRAVQKLLQALSNAPPSHLQQVVWFRLPLPGDERSWPIETLLAVMQDRPLLARTESRRLRNATGGYDVIVTSVGNLAAPLPSRIDVPKGCRGEGVGNYRIEQQFLVTQETERLEPGRSRVVGWLRCEQPLKR